MSVERKQNVLIKLINWYIFESLDQNVIQFIANSLKVALSKTMVLKIG